MITIVLIMVAIAIVVVVAIAIPVVAVFKAATITFPVTIIESFAIVTGANPASARVRRPGPITPMPAVMASDGIPVAIDPHKFWTGLNRMFVIGARRRRSANPYANGHLGTRDVRTRQQQGKKKTSSNQIFHIQQSPLTAK